MREASNDHVEWAYSRLWQESDQNLCTGVGLVADSYRAQTRYGEAVSAQGNFKNITWITNGKAGVKNGDMIYRMWSRFSADNSVLRPTIERVRLILGERGPLPAALCLTKVGKLFPR